MQTTNSAKEKNFIPAFPALVQGKCARCRKGDMFRGYFSTKMLERCDHCGLTYERNPGYFYTAMYVTYVFNVVEIIAFGIATFVFSGGSNNPWLYIGTIIPGVLLLSPLNYRYSRLIQMYWLDPTLKYHPELSADLPKEKEVH